MRISFPRRSGQLPQRPEMFETWAPRFPKNSSGLASALDDLVKAYRGFYEGHLKTLSDETITPGARQVRSAKAARAKLEPLFERLDAAATEASSVVEQLRAKTRVAYNPEGKGYEMVMRHQEIRRHFLSLGQSEKLKALDAARKAGDEDTLIAIASCQSYLSGLPDQLHQHTRDQLIEAHAPSEAAALRGIEEQQKMAAQLRDTMVQSVADLVDFEKADELIAAASTELA